jgi:galactokinase
MSGAVKAFEAFEADELLAALIAREPAAAADPAAIRIVRAPGRVNLIGEYTDINEGLVLPAAIDREIRIAYVPSGDRRVELTRLDNDDRGVFQLDVPRERSGTWLDYVAGTAWALAEAGLPIGGLRGVIGSNLPENAGLSSSAAIELASAWALLGQAAAGLDRLALARVCQRAENGYVGVQSGLMDQFASSCGVAGAALLLDCRTTEWRPVTMPDGLALVVCNTGSPRRLGSSDYNIRRDQCEAAVEGIRKLDPSVRSLRDVSPELLAAARATLEPMIARRAEHVVAENERVLTTLAAFEANDLDAVGELFAASHASLRDLFDVSSPELDALVEIAMAVPGVVAARMTGAGFGGCTVNLVHHDAAGALREAVLASYPARTGLSPMILAVAAANGAGEVARRDDAPIRRR